MVREPGGHSIPHRHQCTNHGALHAFPTAQRDARTLWREIHAHGYPANVGQVCRLVIAWRTSPQAPGVAGQPLPAKDEAVSYSPRQTHWLLTKVEVDPTVCEIAYSTTLKRLCPQIAEAQYLLTTFHTMIAERAPTHLDSWLEQCEQSGTAEFVRFAHGVRRGYPAVHEALRYPWSQGPVEGQVKRVKLLKRQLDGRAGFPLLRDAYFLPLRYHRDFHQPLSIKSEEVPRDAQRDMECSCAAKGNRKETVLYSG